MGGQSQLSAPSPEFACDDTAEEFFECGYALFNLFLDGGRRIQVTERDLRLQLHLCLLLALDHNALSTTRDLIQLKVISTTSSKLRTVGMSDRDMATKVLIVHSLEPVDG